MSRPAQTRRRDHFSRLAGLPKRIELFMAAGGQPPSRVAILSPTLARTELDVPDPNEPTEERWWSSWRQAVDSEFGVEVRLGAVAPQDIDVLYAVGVGRGDPAPLFQAHRDAGALAVLEPGTATNTVDGAPAADLGRGVATWLQAARATGTGEFSTDEISQALCGRPDALETLPGGSLDHRTPNQRMVTALWPVVFGHALKDIWGLGDEIHSVGLWASENLVPEGPLPPVRIGDQPYGLLPTTALSRWHPTPADPPVEGVMMPHVVRLRAAWAAAAERKGTAAGVDTNRLLDLLGQVPASAGYAYREWLPLELVHVLTHAFDGGAPAQGLRAWWNATLSQVLGYPVAPHRSYATLGAPQDLRIPLAEPKPMPPPFRTLGEVLQAIASFPPGALTRAGMGDLFTTRFPPNSLLIRLLVRARLVCAAELARHAAAQSGAALEPLAIDSQQLTAAGVFAKQFDPAMLGLGAPQGSLFAAVEQATHGLHPYPVEVLERVMRATLDTAGHRVDPWVTAFAWRRLQELRSVTPRPTWGLGVYGWVDRPFTGTPGPTQGGLLHAPSQAQALAAAVVRDKAVNDAEPKRWEMQLDSRTIRAAKRLADQVAAGLSLEEALGRELEGMLDDFGVVKQLRTKFPIREAHAGRRVCDGRAVLNADPATLPLSTAQRAALEPLRAAVDAFGDLLVLDAVFAVVTGRGETAGAAMDAAAGLAAPPELAALRTPRTGRNVQTHALVGLPSAALPSAGATASPGKLADPSFAQFLTDAIGAPSGPSWAWKLQVGAQTQTVQLSQLGLEPIDALAVGPDTLRRLAARLAPANASFLPDQPAEASRDRALRLARMLSGRPATPPDLGAQGAQADDTAVRTELAGRLTRLRQSAVAVLQQLQAASTDAARSAALAAALRWGVNPQPHDGSAGALPERVERAHEALNARLAASPDPAAAPLPAEELGAAIARLARTEGPQPVLATMRPANLPSLTKDQRDSVTQLNQLDHSWLSVVAAVRPALAQLERHQLGASLDGSTPFSAWSNRPGDPWQANPPTPTGGLVAPTLLIAVYAPGNVLATSTEVAYCLLDAWGETIPGTVTETSAAFGFNAPAARAPQAILIAVPPVAGQPVDVPALVTTLEETRMLSHARMATPDDLDDLAGALPLTMLPSDAETGVALDPLP